MEGVKDSELPEESTVRRWDLFRIEACVILGLGHTKRVQRYGKNARRVAKTIKRLKKKKGYCDLEFAHHELVKDLLKLKNKSRRARPRDNAVSGVGPASNAGGVETADDSNNVGTVEATVDDELSFGGNDGAFEIEPADGSNDRLDDAAAAADDELSFGGHDDGMIDIDTAADVDDEQVGAVRSDDDAVDDAISEVEPASGAAADGSDSDVEGNGGSIVFDSLWPESASTSTDSAAHNVVLDVASLSNARDCLHRSNAKLLEYTLIEVLELEKKALIVDVTYGEGNFWNDTTRDYFDEKIYLDMFKNNKVHPDRYPNTHPLEDAFRGGELRRRICRKVTAMVYDPPYAVCGTPDIITNSNLSTSLWRVWKNYAYGQLFVHARSNPLLLLGGLQEGSVESQGWRVLPREDSQFQRVPFGRDSPHSCSSVWVRYASQITHLTRRP